jgi:hypothetical protein
VHLLAVAEIPWTAAHNKNKRHKRHKRRATRAMFQLTQIIILYTHVVVCAIAHEVKGCRESVYVLAGCAVSCWTDNADDAISEVNYYSAVCSFVRNDQRTDERIFTSICVFVNPAPSLDSLTTALGIVEWKAFHKVAYVKTHKRKLIKAKAEIQRYNATPSTKLPED